MELKKDMRRNENRRLPAIVKRYTSLRDALGTKRAQASGRRRQETCKEKKKEMSGKEKGCDAEHVEQSSLNTRLLENATRDGRWQPKHIVTCGHVQREIERDTCIDRERRGRKVCRRKACRDGNKEKGGKR